MQSINFNSLSKGTHLHMRYDVNTNDNAYYVPFHTKTDLKEIIVSFQLTTVHGCQ